jgi:hypothetical protein
MSDFSGGPLGATRGRFWSLAHGEESDNNSDDGSAEEFPEEISIDALAAYCKTPEAEDCILSPSSLSAVHRREQKKMRQRAAAVQLKQGMPVSHGSSISPFSKFATRSSLPRRGKFTLNLPSFL